MNDNSACFAFLRHENISGLGWSSQHPNYSYTLLHPIVYNYHNNYAGIVAMVTTSNLGEFERPQIHTRETESGVCYIYWCNTLHGNDLIFTDILAIVRL